MSNRAAPIDRPGARVILLDDADRVLLFSSPMPDGESAGRLWVPPGGAVEAGEDWDAAARRELRATPDVLVPRRIGELLPPIIGGLVPPSPIVVE